MKKVVYLYYDLPEYRRDFFTELSQRLKSKGIVFKFVYGRLSHNKVASIQDDNPPFEAIRLELKEINLYFFKLLIYKGLIKLLKQERPDSVVLQFHVGVLSFWLMYFYLKMHKIPYVTWDCNYTRDTLNDFLVKFRKSLVDFTYKKAKVCITYGTFFRDYLLGIGKPKENIVVAQNTINIERIIRKRSVSCNNREFNHPIRILYVGALLKRKFLDAAICAVDKLIDDGLDIYFDIVGNGKERIELEALIKNKERIIFYGAKKGKQLQVFFENDDVFVLPGTGGLAVNEAMAYSLPIISTVGDYTVIDLLDGNGFLLKKMGDVDEIADAIKEFVALPEADKKYMSRRSEEIILQRATLENMVNQHVVAIEKSLICNY